MVSALPLPAQEVSLVVPPGTSGAVERALRAASLTLAAADDPEAVPQDIVAAARADYRRLLTALYAQGHYGGTISITLDGREADAIQPLEAPAVLSRVILAVDPGPLFTFGRTSIGPLAPDTDLPTGFAPGEPALSGLVRDAATEAVEGWRAQGHARAAVADQEIVAIHPQTRLDAAVTIAPGARLAFGPVAVSGAARVREERIRAIAGVPTGQVFDPLDLERAAARLRRTGAFDAVALVEVPEAESPPGSVPIRIQVTESLPRRFGFGAEISSERGLSANAFWLHRNLLGGAERLRVEGQVANIEGETLGLAGGGIDYALGVSLARPATFGPDTDLTFATRLSREDEEAFLLDQFTFDVGITRYATDDLTLTAAVGVLAARERTAARTRDYTLLTLPLGAVWDRRDDPRDARAGTFLDARATPFVTVAGAGSDGARLYADARAYRALGERVTVAGRAQLGSLLGSRPEDAPADFKFFSGGGGTVRGQPFRSLGVERVVDGTSVVTGGASLAGLQLEARVDVTERIGAVAFADAGLVAPGALPWEDGEWHAGVGLGGRYDTFVGPIRVDLATPATGDDAFGRLQLYIGIGQAF
ncbi:BamA/TamA family outer membrane protein [Rubellimicrobium sp. CFH 75288]|nr:BamA/TamA family outer membrane protein [Rubellimicrobium sp. CFH 75288]